ncbi:MAG: glutamate--tRNA ligase [Candidatus Pacearchaeota archaeon]
MDKEVIKAYALKNAIEHYGKANKNAVLNSLFVEGLKKENIKDILPLIDEVVKEVNSKKIEEQKKEFGLYEGRIRKRKTRGEDELPELPKAIEGNVVMRLAPFPSGPLHIGNTRALILNYEYVKKYKGKFFLFFDDTIGSEEKQIEPQAYKLIEEGINWLGIKPDKVFYKSDRTKKYYEYAEELIKKGHMYVCDCEQEEFQRLKEKGIDCPCRVLPPEKNLERWKKMFSKESKEGDFVVRLKTSMQDPDPAFRDRVMFKISTRPHPRTKNKYKVYPSMEFSWAIDDKYIGTTHVLRGIEHQISTKVQDYIRSIFKWENPISLYLGLFQIEGIKISKSKGAKEVKTGAYIGWNDPRLWSLQSLRDRGIQPEAIRKFILMQGINQSNSTIPVEVLYSINRKILENVERFFILKNPVRIKIHGSPLLKKELIVKKDGSKKRMYYINQEFLIEKEDYKKISDGGIYRLVGLFNFKCSWPNVIKDKYLFFLNEVEEEIRTIAIPWLNASEENVNLRILMPDGNYTKCLGEGSLKNLKEKETVYFEKFGFCKLHKKERDFFEFWFTHN